VVKITNPIGREIIAACNAEIKLANALVKDLASTRIVDKKTTERMVVDRAFDLPIEEGGKKVLNVIAEGIAKANNVVTRMFALSLGKLLKLVKEKNTNDDIRATKEKLIRDFENEKLGISLAPVTGLPKGFADPKGLIPIHFNLKLNDNDAVFNSFYLWVKEEKDKTIKLCRLTRASKNPDEDFDWTSPEKFFDVDLLDGTVREDRLDQKIYIEVITRTRSILDLIQKNPQLLEMGKKASTLSEILKKVNPFTT